MDKALKLKVGVILSELEKMIKNQMPESTLSDDGKQVTGHWSQTKEDMENSIGRKLNPIEVTALSLSRCFGPTPLLEAEEREELFSKIWPEGNSTGNWLGWLEMKEVLEKFPINRIKVTIYDAIEIMKRWSTIEVTFIRFIVDKKGEYFPDDSLSNIPEQNHFEVNSLGIKGEDLYNAREDHVWFNLKTNELLTFEEAKEYFS